MTTSFKASAPKMRATRRGVAWEANVIVDGKIVANVSNKGEGGCDDYKWLDKSFEEAFHNATVEFNAEIISGAASRTFSGCTNADYCGLFFENLMQEAEKALKVKV